MSWGGGFFWTGPSWFRSSNRSSSFFTLSLLLFPPCCGVGPLPEEPGGSRSLTAGRCPLLAEPGLLEPGVAPAPPPRTGGFGLLSVLFLADASSACCSEASRALVLMHAARVERGPPKRERGGLQQRQQQQSSRGRLKSVLNKQMWGRGGGGAGAADPLLAILQCKGGCG